MGNKRTGEPQYRDAIELMKKRPERMGLMSGWPGTTIRNALSSTFLVTSLRRKC